MAGSLFWKEKVVRNFSVTLILSLIFQYGKAQTTFNALENTTSFLCDRLDFQSAIDQLSQAMSLHFVYNSDIIKPGKLYSFSISNKSLDEILAIVGNELGVELKRKSNYVIIKPRDTIISDVTEKSNSYEHFKSSTTALAPDLRKDTQPVEMIKKKPLKNNVSDMSAASSDRHMIGLLPNFDTTLLKKIAPRTFRRLTHPGKLGNFFLGAGGMINNYSGGIELQAGIMPVYFIYSPGWLQNGRFFSRYGAGVSFPLTKKLSFSPSYTYFTVDQKKTYQTVDNNTQFSTYTINQSFYNHQIRFMAEYSLVKDFNIQAGFTFNRSKTSDLNFAEGISTDYPPAFIGTGAGRAPAGAFYLKNPREVPVFTNSATPIEGNRVWFGWEIGILYKLNFSKRP